MLRHLWQQFFECAVNLGVAGNLREKGLFASQQHRLGDYVDDFPSEGFERLRLASTRQQTGEPVRDLHAQHVVGEWVIRRGDTGERKREEYKILFAAGANGSIVSTMQNAEVTLRID